MGICSYPASREHVGSALGVTPTAATRKVQAAEMLLTILAAAGRRLARSGRSDRVTTAVRAGLQTISDLYHADPTACEAWIGVVIEQAKPHAVTADQGARLNVREGGTRKVHAPTGTTSPSIRCHQEVTT